MKEVFQTVIDAGVGNCHQAAVASLLDLELSQVPNFILYSDDTWWPVFCCFFEALNYEVIGTGYPDSDKLCDTEDVNGYFLATVPSRTYVGKSHAVVINKQGMVAHDPNPNGKWFGVNVIQSGDLLHWSIIERRVSR